MSRSRRAAVGPLLGALACGGCALDLLPGESVVPGEVPARTWSGGPGDRLGASLAFHEERLLVGAPGSGAAWILPAADVSWGPEGLGAWVWWWDGVPHGARQGDGVYRLDVPEAVLRFSAPEAVSFAGGSQGGRPVVALATPAGVELRDPDGNLLAHAEVAGLERVALGEGRLLLLACSADGCTAAAWWPEVDGTLEVLGEAGAGGAIGEVDGIAWWGAPDHAGDRGRVCAEDGRCVEGEPGDRLGRALCETHTAGVLNSQSPPSRARVVPLAGGEVLAVDRGREGRPVVLGSGSGGLAIGIPDHGVTAAGDGRVLWVSPLDLF